MLILTRKPGESVYIGDNVKVTIVEIKGHQIRIGIDAPKEMRIYREEIYLQILEENRQAAEAARTSESGLDSLAQAWEGKKPKATMPGKKPSSGSIAAVKSPSSSKEDPAVVVKRKKKTTDE